MILGAGVMQAPAIRIAREMGWTVVCADGNPHAPAVSDADKFLHIDLKDLEGLEVAARELSEKEGLDGVLTAGTDFSASVAWIAEKLGLPGISYQTGLNATDKIRMRRCFRDSQVPSPLFVELSQDMDFASETARMPYPLVVKPVDNMGARGVRKLTSSDGLDKAVNEAIAFSRTGRAIVEEFIAGPEYSIDALVENGVVTIHGLAERHIYFPPCFIEMGHTMPALISDEKRREIEEVFKKGVAALGIDCGAAKGDIIYSKNGPVVGEIAARLSGGYMSGWTFPLASGIESTKGALKIAVGGKADSYDGSYKKVCAERAFLSIPGTVKSIENINEAYKTEYVNDLFLRIEEGDIVDFPVNNVEKCGNFISSHEERALAIGSAEKAAARILVRLDERDNRTGEFLYIEKNWPADAFSLNNTYTAAAYEDLTADRDFPFDNVSFKGFKPVPLSDLAYETSRDWQGRSLENVFREILALTGLEEASVSVDQTAQAYFWRAVIKGSIQGGLWFFDRFCSN
ncbi:MAG: ATP-grasp domain-containing protein [Spirochaetales bacterium]|nr:ATP-grasp domain-containing protein [Spirochaetales bacterium]